MACVWRAEQLCRVSFLSMFMWVPAIVEPSGPSVTPFLKIKLILLHYSFSVCVAVARVHCVDDRDSMMKQALSFLSHELHGPDLSCLATLQ